jgi:uncharacterized damage-inducible protein DinB
MSTRSAQQASPREQLLSNLERETATTLKVLKAYPPDQSELRPHPRAKTARELAWMFTLEQKLSTLALRDQLDLSGGFPPAPADMAEVVAAFEKGREEILTALRGARDEDLDGTVPFFIGPGQMGDVPKVAFLWFILHDQIHHRGQFSVYLRMAGGKVPSIYGPTADEPWF